MTEITKNEVQVLVGRRHKRYRAHDAGAHMRRPRSVLWGALPRSDRADRDLLWVREIENALIIGIAADDFAVLREDCFKCEVFFCGKRFALTCRVLKVIVVTERREQECVGALRGSSQRKQFLAACG